LWSGAEITFTPKMSRLKDLKTKKQEKKEKKKKKLAYPRDHHPATEIPAL
jgi:hypothetical protein